MDAWQSFKRKREMRKVKRAAGVKAGRGGRRASGGGLVVRPKEPASVHQLMAEDARPNLRVWQMWDEACDFEGELGHFRENLGKFENATDEFLKHIEPILRAPLPRVWDAVDGGLAEPTRATISHGHQHTVGGDASIAGLEEARSEFHNRLRGHVVRPLHQWSEALGVVEERLPELKRLRQEVIKSSRAASRSSRQYKDRAGMATEVDEQSGAIVPFKGGGEGGGIRSVFGACGRPQVGHRGGAGGRRGRRQARREENIEDEYYTSSSSDDDQDYQPRESGVDRTTRREIEVEEAGMRLNYKHRELQAARADYAEAEKLIAEQLTGLQRDAAWTKSYMVSALLLTKEAMQTSVVSLGNTKQPLPGFQGRGSVLAARHGELTDNVQLAAGMPEDIDLELFQAHAHGGTAFGSRAVAALPPMVHAHKATAAPTELHARPDVGALDRVNTPPTGAGAIPMSALSDLNINDRAGMTTSQAGTGQGSGLTGLTTGTSGYRQHGQAGYSLGGRKDETEAAYYATSPTSPTTSARGARFSDASDAGVLGGSTAGSSGFRGSGVELRPGSGSGVAAETPLFGQRGIGVVGGDVSVVREDQSEYVCSRKTFTEVEDRPIVKGRVETIIEHRPVEKEYVTEVRYEGERPMAGSAEHIDTKTRVVATTPPGPVCPTGMAPDAATRRHRRRGSRSSSSSSSSSSSGDEREGGYHRAARGTVPVSGGVGVGGHVGSVLREDQSEVVCGRKEFTEVEDRPIVKERVETIVEHRPVEKEYVTELRYAGEEALPGSVEAAGPAETRTVEEAAPGPKCPRGVCEGACACTPEALAAAPAGVDDMVGDRDQRVAAM